MFNIFNGENEKQLSIKSKFTERYRVLQHSAITMGSLVIDTSNECRWDIRVIDITENYYHIELLTLDNVLTNTNNENIRELSLLNNAFKKMYNELNFFVDKKGTLIKLLNLDVIKRKWQQVKTEMQAIQDKYPSINGLINLNEEIFASDDKILEAVRNNEFFEIYFYQFWGRNINGNSSAIKKSLFMQAEVDWRYQLSQIDAPDNHSLSLNSTGTPVHRIDSTWLTKAYGSFPITTATDLKPAFAETANYLLDNATGKILKGTVIKEEIAHPQLLHSKVEFIILADSFENADKTAREPNNTHKEPHVNSTPARSFFVD